MPNIQFQLRRGTASEWTSANPTLAVGEMGVETSTNRFKIGTGTTPWNTLGYTTGFAFKGSWSSGTSYVVNDVVTYNGSAYICTSATSSTTTPDLLTANWSVLVQATTSIVPTVTVLDDISGEFEGTKTNFQLKSDNTPINIQADSKNFEVFIDGKRLTPYVTRSTYPWLTEYDSFKGFRVRQVSNSNYMTIYNAPYIGDSALVILRTPTSNTQIVRYPFSTTTIAFGD
jgi:hypothetical protein